MFSGGRTALQPLIFGNAQESGDAALAEASPVALNVLVDGKGAVRRRPGLVAYDGVVSSVVHEDGIAGLHVTTTGDQILAVGENRRIYRVDDVTAEDLSTTVAQEVAGTERPTFAENEVAVVIAGGGVIQKIALSGFASTRLSATSTDAPPSASHVIAHNQRFLANDLASSATAGQVRYSKLGQTDYDEWPARYLFTGEAKPDPIRAIHENINEVWVFGTQTTQLFVPDPSSVYAPLKPFKHGISAAYSVIGVDANFAWLDDRRRFVLSSGGTPKDISGPIAKTLDEITTWDDCFGYRVAQDQFDCLVWTFPTDGRSFCYQLNGGWSQWQGRTGSAPTLFPVTAHAFRESDGTDIVGLSTGRVCKLSTGAHTDLGDPIVADVTTGFLSRGTDAQKWCKVVRFVMRRGHATGSEEPVAFLSWRDDLGDWEDPVAIGLGSSSDREAVVELRSLGVYRRRQWRLTFSGGDEWLLASASEEFEVLSS